MSSRESGGRTERGQVREEAEHLHEPACRLGAAGRRACWGGTEVVQHEVVQSAYPRKAHHPGASL